MYDLYQLALLDMCMINIGLVIGIGRFRENIIGISTPLQCMSFISTSVHSYLFKLLHIAQLILATLF